MKHVTKRLLSILMVLSIITSLLAGITAVSAAGTYNTGVRGELCTSLSSQAKAYYTGSYTYDTLSTLSGSTLKSRISSLVTSDRDTVGYNGLKTYFAQTDAHLGSSSKLNLFYCNIPTNSAWDGADSYNREHMWPDSLGGNAAEGDLHSMRPTDAYVNSKRGNSKYGYVTGGKDATASPTNGSVVGGTYGGSYFEPLDFAKGDCARVILYDYATYSSLSSITTVFESVDVLLEWCALDPVDEFEMTRNDVVEDIQGCRNPFVDYPELAWIMLGKEIPTDMPTPTNEGGSAYTVTAASSNINNGTVSISGRVITATPAEGWYAASYQVSPEGAATVARDGNTFTVSNITADCTVTIHFAQSAAASIRYIVPDGVSVSGPTASYVGSAITLPTVSGKPSDTSQNYSFFGWATSPVVDTTSVSSFLKYDAGASYLVDDTALTFYAVYTYTIAGTGGSSDTFTKITAAKSDWSGDYVLSGTASNVNYALLADGSAVDTAIGSSSSAIPFASAGLSLNGNTLTNVTDSYVVSISPLGNGKYAIALKGASTPVYLAYPGSGNALTTATNTEDALAQWTLSFSGTYVTITNAGDTGRVLQFNASSQMFRCYTGSQTPLIVYGASASSVSHYLTITTAACTHEGTIVTDAAVAATCTETGLTEGSHCSNCGAVIVAQTVTAATGHSYVVSGELAPTETTDGYIAYTCSVCGDSYTQIVSALPCTHTGTIVTDAAVAATCTETGLTEGSHCSNCGATLVAQTVTAATGHDYVGVETLAPTATVDGIMTYTCANCNDAYTVAIPALGGEHVCPADAFSDLDKNSWYHEGVDYMLDGGYMNGVSSNRFDPNGNITRGMIVTVLWRLEGSPAAEASPFTDVPAGKYYTTAIAWAQKNSIVNGTSATTFAPDDFVTREQIAAILYRYNNSPAVSGSLAAYPDAGSVSTYAISAITWATANGVINGSDGKLLPQDNATRAQFATMLFRAENLAD